MILTKFASNTITLSIINTLSSVTSLALPPSLSLKKDNTSAPRTKLEALPC